MDRAPKWLLALLLLSLALVVLDDLRLRHALAMAPLGASADGAPVLDPGEPTRGSSNAGPAPNALAWDAEERGARHPEAAKVSTEKDLNASRAAWRARRLEEISDSVRDYASVAQLSDRDSESLQEVLSAGLDELLALRQQAIDGHKDKDEAAAELDEARARIDEDVVAILGEARANSFYSDLPPVLKRSMFDAQAGERPR